jgi:DNA integrity scanning protein DisA with diadenylate cyclase activity
VPETMQAMGPGPESVTAPGDDHGPTLYLPELSEAVHDALIKAGYGSVDELAAASDRELEAVPGIGRATVRRIRAAMK